MAFFCAAPGYSTTSRNFQSAHMRNTIARLVIILLLLLLISDDALSNTAFQPFKDDPNEPWHIQADEISYDKNLEQYIAKGHVTITKMDKHLTADLIRFNQKTMQVLAVGHAVMTVGEDVLIGNRMEMDLKTETGTVYNGTIFLKDKHFYIKGDKIQKIGPDAYTADKGCLTTCDGDHPAWKITGKNLKVTIEGYGFVNHAALWTKYIPVMYSPWLMFPVKIKRQTGLLPPQFGYSDRKWEEYIQPLYLVIDDSSDATFYLHHMGRRGQKLGLEYRYVLSQSSKGTVMYDYLRDKKTDGGDPEKDKDWGYFDDNVPRPNSDRYWFRMKHDQPLPRNFSAKLDIDFVSDQDYLKEFRYGYTGFEETNDYFIKTFGRELDDYDESTRVNRLNLNRSWPRYSLNSELRWYDNVVNRRQSETDTTLQKLPFVEFNASKQQILGSPFYYDLDSEYDYFYREDGQRGHRADVYPRVYLPYKFGHYFSIEPSMGIRETIYHFDKYEYRGPTKEKNLSREMYDIKIDSSSEIYRIYSGFGENNVKIKHTLRPQVVYTYTPHKDQNKYPSFDAIDRIAKQRLLTYSLKNTFTSKSLKQKKKNGVPDKNENRRPSESFQQMGENSILEENRNGQPPDYAYNQFCRFKLEQSYDINEAKEDKAIKEPFSPIYGEIQLAPGRYFSMQADAARSPYNSFWQSYNVAVNIWNKRKDQLFVERRYTHNASDSIFFDLSVVISEKLKVLTDYERNLHDGRDIKKSIGFLYESQCWSLKAAYIHEGDDRRYMFMVGLKGIGEFAQSLAGRSFEKPFATQ